MINGPLGYRTIYVSLGPFMSMCKWSGRAKYDDINGPPDHLCYHRWSLRTIYTQTTYRIGGNFRGIKNSLKAGFSHLFIHETTPDICESHANILLDKIV